MSSNENLIYVNRRNTTVETYTENVEQRMESESEKIVKLLMLEGMQLRHRGPGLDSDAKKRDSKLMTWVFTGIVCAIFATIGFSIWLSVEVGMNGRNVWNSGKDVWSCTCMLYERIACICQMFHIKIEVKH